MVNQPKLLLADEPTGAPDSRLAQILLETFTDLNREMQATILMVTHDAFSASYCGRILFLQDEKIFHELVRGTKSRKVFLQEIGEELIIGNAAGDGVLTCAGIQAEPFSQDGHNGADYMVVVPDEVLTRMQPYYTELVADLDGEAPIGLQHKLKELLPEEDPDRNAKIISTSFLYRVIMI